MQIRMRLTTTVAVLALSIAVVTFGAALGASATQGQPVIAGQDNTATDQTVVRNTNVGLGCTPEGFDGLKACGFTGVEGFGTRTGVFGSGPTGVQGFGTTQNGVFGETDVDTASGVYGQNNGTGFGVAGRANGGTGVLGESANGVGVFANSPNSTALKVNGKARFSRSGRAVVAGTGASPKSSVTVGGVALTNKSLVLATLQKNALGVYVQAAVPNVASSSITIYLNQNVTSSFPIAWMVIERP